MGPADFRSSQISCIFPDSRISQNSPNSFKNQDHGKVLTSGKKERIVDTPRKERIPAPPPTKPPFILGTEYFHWPAWAICLAMLPPSTCTPAHGRLKKVLDFLATIKNISAINTLLILNPKPSSYWEEN